MDTTQAGGAASGDDPGWGPALKRLPWMLIPGLGAIRLRWRRGSGGRDGLTELRSLFLAFLVSLGYVGVVVAFLAGSDDDPDPSLPAGAGAILVSAAGVLCVLLVRLLRPPFVCSSDATLAASYRTRFFLRLAYADMAALTGFVGYFLTDNPALYPLGVAFSLVGFASLAPTAAHLEADQEDLDTAGCNRSLILALRTARR